jgi:hypothetical protein
MSDYEAYYKEALSALVECRDEIERLRELLNEGLRKHENYPGGYIALRAEPGLFEYWKRVKGILGNE